MVGSAVPLSAVTAASAGAAVARFGTVRGGATGRRFFAVVPDIEAVCGSGVFGGCQILSKSGFAGAAWAAGTARRDAVRATTSGTVARVREGRPDRRMPKRGIVHPPLKVESR
ncbi:hypothetical protein GCM10010275_38760 [Streptomyces litmocidini]|nr:hypothetical protein GCM10010275_38760 [Streptomyces litmocidini]